MDQWKLTKPACQRSSISMVLNRWRNNHKIEQIGDAKYKKL